MASNIRNYAVVTSAYWGFTLTDGALRMLVLLHFHQLGYSPLAIATPSITTIGSTSAASRRRTLCSA